MPRETIWRRRILLKPIIDVSEAENKKDTSAKKKRNINIIGSGRNISILAP